ncbi:uncharacterized protein TNIN_444101 [Trichonephila inaurata madagascariensis]|uniref:Uncharacterized protein n=1 Tax=Trichonephila inaurata madagascariensis TaxID=2747483 RepID=A0A8X6XQF4_9ARAC|nr:uncharacterized protein TNIN_444101 [Trichonephila inaurata madagascariensis]
MSRKKVFKTAKETVEYLFSEEFESEMIALPPEVDELTDKKVLMTQTLDPSVRDVAGSIEISVSYEKHDDHREKGLSNKSKKQSCSESGSNTGLGIRCGNNDYCYNFDLYCGKEVVDAASTVVFSKEPLGTRVVKKMLQPVTDPKSHTVYFDKFF